MATKDGEGFWRGACKSHPPGRFEGCPGYERQEGTNKCGKCGCVARAHFVVGKCKRHAFCGGYEETLWATDECANCGCTVEQHLTVEHNSSHPVEVSAQNESSEARNVWGEIAKAARAEREKMRGTHPPGRSGPQAKAHGGKRADSGRKKAIYKKDVQICPVRIKNSALGTYSTCGKRIFVSLKGKPQTLATLEDTSLQAVFGITREDAVRFDIEFYMLKTLKGPRLQEDNHILGSNFYLYCSTSDEQFLDNKDDSESPSETSTYSGSHNSVDISTTTTSSLAGISSTTTANIPTQLSATSTRPRFSSAIAMSVRSRNVVLKSLRATMKAAAPARPPVDPSKLLGLGRSLALPVPSEQGWITHSIELFNFAVDDDWSSVRLSEPESSILSIEGYPGYPFQAGAFQLAYKAKCKRSCPVLRDDPTYMYVFKQHKLEEYGLREHDIVESLTDDEILNINTANRKRTAKEAQIAAVANALCHHFNKECERVPDYGRKISILPCYYVRLTSAVCPVWGVLEPYLETSAWPWLKFLNNDGIPVGDGGSAGTWPASIKEMQLKAESFAHWTLDKFKGRAFVCDLQGMFASDYPALIYSNRLAAYSASEGKLKGIESASKAFRTGADFKLTDLEIASADSSLFGIGNLSTVALDNFKLHHRCNVYCAALGLKDDFLTSMLPRAESAGTSTQVIHVDDEVSFHVDIMQEVEGEMSQLQQAEQIQAPLNAVKSTTTGEEDTLCKICLQEKVNSVFYDCGHTYACYPCAEKCAELKKCPLCRKEIKDVVRLFS